MKKIILPALVAFLSLSAVAIAQEVNVDTVEVARHP